MDLKFLLIDTRARVYLIWAVLATVGFVATHYFQRRQINIVWTIISIIGLGYMYKVMPLSVRQMRHIFISWLIPIIVGMCVSGAIFFTTASWATSLMAHLGAFWLAVMAVAYTWNGIADGPPAFWYWFAASLNVLASVLCFTVDSFTAGQYLIAAVVTAWSMLNLWLFRSSVN